MFILEEQSEIPVTAEVDVLVIGSGPAGVSAAVTAGREGMSTMLIEQAGDVGGIATVGHRHCLSKNVPTLDFWYLA